MTQRTNVVIADQDFHDSILDTHIRLKVSHGVFTLKIGSRDFAFDVLTGACIGSGMSLFIDACCEKKT